MRLTIHPSNKSTDHNQINIRTILKNGKKLQLAALTTALKAHNEFVLLYSRRNHALADYRGVGMKPGPHQISLGEIDEKQLTLHYTLFLSYAAREFRAEEAPDINVKQIEIGDFKLTFLWSFLPIIALANAMNAYGFEPPSKDVRPYSRLPLMNEERAFKHHRALAEKGFDEWALMVVRTLPARSLGERVTLWNALAARKRLLKSGSSESPQFLAVPKPKTPIRLWYME